MVAGAAHTPLHFGTRLQHLRAWRSCRGNTRRRLLETAVQNIEQEILNTEQMIAGLPASEVRALEKSLRNLTPSQRACVTDTLRRLQDGNALAPRYLQLLEYFFDRWSGHSLATKLVLIGRIARLSSETVLGDAAAPWDFRGLFGLPPLLQKAS